MTQVLPAISGVSYASVGQNEPMERPSRSLFVFAALGLVPLTPALINAQTTPPPPPKLTITISGLPQGVLPDVDFASPSEKKAITEGFVLENPAAGDYTLTPRPVRNGDPVVDTIYEAKSAKLSLKANGSGTLSVTYAPRGGTGFLWVATERITVEDDFSKGQLRGFRAASLAKGSIGAPDRTIPIEPRGSHVAVDGLGNLVSPSPWSGFVYRWAPSGLGAASVGSTTAIEELAYDGAVAFDPRGNLWVVSPMMLQMIAAADLMKANPKVSRTIKLPEGDDIPGLGSPLFAADGTLYCAGRNTTIFSPNELASSGVKRGRLIAFEDTGSTGQASWGPDGRIWFADENSTIWAASVDQLKLGGGGQPEIQTEAPLSVHGLTFDNSGNMLFTTRFEGGKLYRRAADKIAENGGELLGDFPSAGYSTLHFNPVPSWHPLASMPGLSVVKKPE